MLPISKTQTKKPDYGRQGGGGGVGGLEWGMGLRDISLFPYWLVLLNFPHFKNWGYDNI